MAKYSKKRKKTRTSAKKKSSPKPGIGPLPPQAPIAPVFHKVELEPPSGTMLNPADTNPLIGKPFSYKVAYTVTSPPPPFEILPAVLGEYKDYFNFNPDLIPALPPTRWERFKGWLSAF